MKSISDKEKESLVFWEEHNIFQRSVQERPEDCLFTFYDGPPFATGLPHYGHIIASLMKDVVPRYWTMKGYRVNRVWGWDCHGLPIENIIEGKLNLKTKKDIESYGVVNFNEQCRATVLEYAHEWKKTVRRMGRWVDMEHAYMTMDPPYMESVWWVFSELWKKGLIEEGKKAMHVCPRCVTTLSNFEVTLGYKEVVDISATVKFKLTNAKEKIGYENISILAWTTTPWTLPGNVLLAAGHDVVYVVMQHEQTGEHVIIAKSRLEEYQEQLTGYVQCGEVLKSKDLVGLTYEPLFPYFKNNQNSFRVVEADFVNTEEGTGIVHIAPAFGEDDYQLGIREHIPFIQHVSMDGKFIQEVTDFLDLEVKPKEDPSKTDIEIIKYLAHAKKLFSKKKYTHSYPHCWRCDTPLINYATSSWFVKVTNLKEQLLKNNAQTSWIPEHMKEGRFGKWLESARDWAISRSRYWGTPLPIWKSEDGDVHCIGSIAELETLSGQKVTDLHKHIIDSISFEKNGKVYRHIPEVLDCWFESGSMPYAQHHYPFEHKEQFEQGYPAQFIAEGQDQTRGWFYTLHVLATALTSGVNPSIQTAKGSVPAFLNVIVNGIVLAEDGKKMAKRLKNYPDPLEVIETYGADAMRYYLVTSPAMYAENLNFSEQGVRECYNKIVNTLENTLAFYQLFGRYTGEEKQSTHILDSWIVSKLHRLAKVITEEMDAYRLSQASRPLIDFMADLSQWYIRRSRERFKSEDSSVQNEAHATLHAVLSMLSKLIAPFMPFCAERIHTSVGGKELSVHLELWPQYQESSLNEKIERSMDVVKKIVELGHSLRAEHKVKVRQPLAEFHCNQELEEHYLEIIADELNVKRVISCSSIAHDKEWKEKKDGTLEVHLNLLIDKELKEEGTIRELTRFINTKRKELGFTISDTVLLTYITDAEELKMSITNQQQLLMRGILADSICEGSIDDMDELSIDGATIKIAIKKV